MSAADRQRLQELLPAVILGIALPNERQEVLAALETDADLKREAQELELALTGLGASESTPAPAGLRSKLMAQARAEKPSNLNAQIAPTAPITKLVPVAKPVSRRNVLGLLGGLALAAAVAGVILIRPANVIPDASVVANTPDGGLIVANSGMQATPVTFIAANGTKRNISFKLEKPATFTRAVSSQGLSYVLDAANAKLFIIDENQGKMIDEWPVPFGASGVAVEGETVVVMGAASGTVLTFRKNGIGSKTMVEARVSKEIEMSLEDCMDAAVIADGKAYVTHHASGAVSEIDVLTGKERKRFQVGQRPVSLAIDGKTLFVLDLQGTLYKLERETGRVLDRLNLKGTPDRLTLAPGVAYLSDRAGFVTAVKTQPLAVLARKQLAAKLMDLAPMPDGHIAVAAAEKGVMILNDKLEQLKSF